MILDSSCSLSPRAMDFADDAQRPNGYGRDMPWIQKRYGQNKNKNKNISITSYYFAAAAATTITTTTTTKTRHGCIAHFEVSGNHRKS